jgi:hypothetical protein
MDGLIGRVNSAITFASASGFPLSMESSVVMRGPDPRIHLLQRSSIFFRDDGLPGHRRAKRRRSSNGSARQ